MALSDLSHAAPRARALQWAGYSVRHSGPRDPGLPALEHSGLFAQRTVRPLGREGPPAPAPRAKNNAHGKPVSAGRGAARLQ